jgi:hypothetical protein
MAAKWSSGFLRDEETGAVATTTNMTSAKWFAGFLRDPSGALVVTTQ